MTGAAISRVGLCRRLVLVLALALLACAAAASGALAAEYTAEICGDQASSTENLTTSTEPSAGITTRLCGFGPAIEQQGNGNMSGGQGWTLTAPTGTKIHSLTLTHFFGDDGSWGSGIVWALFNGADAGEELFELARQGSLPPEGGTRTYPVNSTSVTGRVSCPQASCNGFVFLISMKNVSAQIEDDTAPTLTVGGPALAGGPLRGKQELTFDAADVGGGVARAILILDGREEVVPQINGGRCTLPYKSVKPCAEGVKSAFTIDTTTLAEGTHKVRVAVEDAAGQRTESDEASIVVHNGPTNTEPPEITGSARVGGALTSTTGSWEGRLPALGYSWLRCPAGVPFGREASRCTPIPGADQARYTPVAADAGSRDLAIVTGSNAAGSASAPAFEASAVVSGPGGGTDGTPPALSGVSLSRKRFKAAAGATLTFSSSEPARVLVTIERLRGARKSQKVATLSRSVAAGRASLAIGGRSGKRLAPGSYRLTIVARDAAGNASKPLRRAFSVSAR